MIKKQVLVSRQQGSIRLYATENPCAKCPSGCKSVASPPVKELQTIDFVWPSTHLNFVAFCLFGLPLLLLIAAVWLMDGYTAQITSISSGLFAANAPILALAVGLGMLFGGRLARKKSRSLLLTLKEAMAVPTMMSSDNEQL